jgi:hypothetical protein
MKSCDKATSLINFIFNYSRNKFLQADYVNIVTAIISFVKQALLWISLNIFPIFAEGGTK